MARVVVVHGVGYAYEGPHSARQEIGGALADGVALAQRRGMAPAAPSEFPWHEIALAFYGDLFRTLPGTKAIDAFLARDGADGSDFTDAYLATLDARAALHAAREAAARGAGESKGAVTRGIKGILTRLARSQTFAALSEQALWGQAEQARMYLTDPQLRSTIRDTAMQAITDDTLLVIGHSLGSVIAVEALHAMRRVRSDRPLDFVTLGSPIGYRELFLQRLHPPPNSTGRLPRPAVVRDWLNGYDEDDLVAAQGGLAACVDGPVQDVAIDNGPHPHALVTYLRDPRVGAFVARALA